MSQSSSDLAQEQSIRWIPIQKYDFILTWYEIVDYIQVANIDVIYRNMPFDET